MECMHIGTCVSPSSAYFPYPCKLSSIAVAAWLLQVEVLTKGDNNRVDDRGLYAPGQLWLQREDILGRARGTLRYLGMVTIILNDYPILKYVLIGIMGLFVLTNKES